MSGVSARDPLDEAVLADTLGSRWARVSVVDEVASTNAELLADSSAPDRSALVAEHQVAGRGRFDRSWESPAGAGLTFSVLLRPTVPMTTWGWLPLLAGVALAEGVEHLAPGLTIALKWPNDLLLARPDARPEAKAAGILVQTGADDAVVIGIGLNVSTTADELPVPGATSLALVGADVDRTELLVAVLNRLDARYAQLSDVDGDAEACALAADYRGRCATLGQDVVVHTPSDELRGHAVDIDPAGRLVLDVNGSWHSVSAGDVEHLRSQTGG